ncbi:hypothetical protein HNQ94_002271 [Salirhabdus euzebyi]|uniref:DUF4363 family protein n=1 Tax=Salirhabdus euzebyi TaxID=394506 RepID=A0A841Q5Y3_9BACI|nr:DUF4363 family protein [Salirhabdus euzebyi]MBB6453820.1 hypothetical protein [Salirhabdus euzebyi]
MLNKLKKFVTFSILLILLASCAPTDDTKKDIEQSLDQIKSSVKINDWQQASKEVDSLNKKYDKHLWKMQMLGEENSYEQMKIEIEQLRAAIEDETKSNITKEVATIRAYLNNIFRSN